MVIFQMVHKVGTITLHLLIGSDGTKNDFRKTLLREHTETDAADRTLVLD